MLRRMFVILLICGLSKANAFENEPGGFRGVVWGADISTVTGLSRSSFGEGGPAKFEYYSRKGDKMSFAGVVADEVLYGFFGGKFAQGVITYRDLNVPGGCATCYPEIANSPNLGGQHKVDKGLKKYFGKPTKKRNFVASILLVDGGLVEYLGDVSSISSECTGDPGTTKRCVVIFSSKEQVDAAFSIAKAERAMLQQKISEAKAVEAAKAAELNAKPDY